MNKPLRLLCLALCFNTIAASAAEAPGNSTCQQAAPSAAGLKSPPEQSGKNYFDQISSKGISRWPDSRIPLRVYIRDGAEVPGYRSALAVIFKQALNDWEMASGGRLKFVFVADPVQADISCNWTNDRSAMSFQKEEGHAVIIPDAQGILKAEILLLTVPPPAMPALTDRYARRVALHEIGHALGISGHSPDASDVMYGTNDLSDRDAAISAADASTLIMLYTGDRTRSAPQLSGTGGTVLPAGTSPEMQALRLNNEAAEAMNKKQLDIALSRLEQAHRLDPKSQLINGNLGSIYANYAAMAGMLRNFTLADSYFGKAIPLLEQSPNKSALLSVLQNYSMILRLSNRLPEALKTEARIKQLQASK